MELLQEQSVTGNLVTNTCKTAPNKRLHRTAIPLQFTAKTDEATVLVRDQKNGCVCRGSHGKGTHGTVKYGYKKVAELGRKKGCGCM